ncbi:excinuclease ABC subunit UvrA [Candidatus Dojkabacteria bacterium]|nr:excinuclease ABC subunit UvrA [Candidatus Dojkabacteria bacterium]
MEQIKIRGARTNNLKNINLDIPKDKLTVITGLSGSGKSSLAFDTIYAEGQRKYVESLSAYARQFLGLMDKPDVDTIEGLSPAISIDQKSTGHNPRSTVGTVTEIYDYLRLLYARVGHPRSPVTGRRLEKQTVQQIVDDIFTYFEKFNKDTAEPKEIKILVLAPLIKARKGTYEELFTRFLSQGYARVRVDGQVYSLEEDIKLDKFVKHNIELVVDRLVIKKDSKSDEALLKRVTDSIELSLNLGNGEVLINLVDAKDLQLAKSGAKVESNGDIFYSEKLVDPETGQSFPEVEPHSFSFNSPFGACPVCNGLGSIKEIDPSNIYNPRLTIAEGGIYPWARVIENEDSYSYNLLEAMASAEKISLKAPIGELEPEKLNMVLYGTGNKEYKVKYTNMYGQERSIETHFEGVIPNLMRRYNESDSDYIKGEIEQYMIERQCNECKGYRLKKEALAVTIRGLNIVDVGNMSISQSLDWINGFKEAAKDSDTVEKSTLHELFNLTSLKPAEDDVSESEKEIGKQIFKEISTRLNFLVSVGLDYLTLNRTARTLSGGESQRIRLASQIGTGLTGVLYVLDEPSIGLHQRDNEKLINTLEKLKEIGNTVIVVEHDEDTIRKADHVIDIGPGAGEHGGQVIAEGNVEDIIAAKDSITGKYLSGQVRISKELIYNQLKKLNALNGSNGTKNGKGKLVVKNVTHHNLKGIDLEIPLGKFVCVTGVSGSGKSSLINDVLYKSLAKQLYGAKDNPGEYGEMRGIENIDKVIDIDQSPIGRTPRSNPATYTGIFNVIRDIFAQTKEAKVRGYKPGRFSFNVKGGRCEKCEGAGVIKISMQFLPDVYVTCEVCGGHRYNRETLQIDYKGKNISEVLDMTVEEGVKFFENITAISSKLKTLEDVGLGYIRLGQGATTLSGGESQRVKLASELSKRSTGKTLYILDEPTTGLHFEDVRKLLIVLHGLVAKGNSVLVIEHNLDLIKTADWIIDLGPEGGQKGGYIIAEGTPEEIAKTEESYTGQWLRKVL